MISLPEGEQPWYYPEMPQSIVKVLVHIVFSTKDRQPLIPTELEPRLYAYISGIIANNKGRMIIAGGIADHIHILVSLGRIDISELIGDIKRESSKWMKENGVKTFYWQRATEPSRSGSRR